MGKLFGTDGIRGVANVYPMTPETAVKIGRAVAYFFKAQNQERPEKSKIVIGKDTRISGDMLESALVAGICSMGVDAYLAGVLPTPGVACLTSSMKASAGIVISASHNPFYDNGIKIFKGDGFKLADDTEDELEQLLKDKDFPLKCESIRDVGRVFSIENAGSRYAAFLKQTLADDCRFEGMKIVLDCSNGATYQVVPELFKELGTDFECLSIHPDGKNINDQCGSQHPDNLIQKVLENRAEAGLAFDGDGDRLIAVDETGRVITGDQILAICAQFAKKQNKLKNNTAVSTVMSNMGLRKAFQELGIKHIMSQVGDRYVLEKMLECGAEIGGEDSGHMIFLNCHTTGDGLLTALRLLEVMKTTGKSLSELAAVMTVFPQVLLNVDVKRKPDLATVPEIQNAIAAVEAKLGEKGRVLVRYSGTQPLCRIMVEGPDIEQTEKYCRQISDVVRQTIGI